MEDNKLKTDQPIQDQQLYMAFQMMKRGEHDAAEQHLKNGIKIARQKEDDVLEGLYLSGMGVLFKLKKDYKKSYKFYQQAEKFLKEDHSIKIISALLLIQEFKQYETAVRKLAKVVEQSQDPALLHHARCIQAWAYFLMKKKDKAKDLFETVIEQDFKELRMAANIEFKAIEVFIQKDFCLELCAQFLQKAHALAKSTKEKTYEAVIEVLIELLGST